MYETSPIFAAETTNGRGHDRAEALRALLGDAPTLYAIRLTDGIVKIGCTRQLWRRRNYFGLSAEIIGFRFGDMADEKALHASLTAHLARGREYYHPTTEVIDVVNSMRDEWNLPHVA